MRIIRSRYCRLIEREFAAIWKAVEAQGEISAGAEMATEFRAIAERRVRLGMVIAELARRSSVRVQDSAELEDKVVDLLVSQARVEERVAGVEELRELMNEG